MLKQIILLAILAASLTGCGKHTRAEDARSEEYFRSHHMEYMNKLNECAMQENAGKNISDDQECVTVYNIRRG